MGLERLVEEQPQDYIGKAALERIRNEGVDRKLVGIEFDGRGAAAGHHPLMDGQLRAARASGR